MYEPFTFKRNGVLVGFEVKVWNEIAKKIGAKVQFVQSPYSELFGMLERGEIDTIANQVAKTPQREEKYLFTDPYSYDEMVIAVHKKSSFKKLKDLRGKKIGVGKKSSFYDVLTKKYDKKTKIIAYKDSSFYQDLVARKIDAIAQDKVSINRMKTMDLMPLRILEEKLVQASNAYAFKKDKKKLVTKINKAIKELKDEGTLKKISVSWIGVDITTSD